MFENMFEIVKKIRKKVKNGIGPIEVVGLYNNIKHPIEKFKNVAICPFVSRVGLVLKFIGWGDMELIVD